MPLLLILFYLHVESTIHKSIDISSIHDVLPKQVRTMKIHTLKHKTQFKRRREQRKLIKKKNEKRTLQVLNNNKKSSRSKETIYGETRAFVLFACVDLFKLRPLFARYIRLLIVVPLYRYIRFSLHWLSERETSFIIHNTYSQPPISYRSGVVFYFSLKTNKLGALFSPLKNAYGGHRKTF